MARPAGGARGAPLHRPGVFAQRLQSSDVEAPRGERSGARRLATHDDGVDVQHRVRRARSLGVHVGDVARARRPAQGDVRRGAVVRRRLRRRGDWRRAPHPPDPLRGLRALRRGVGARVHLARVDAHQVVPRSTRHGHGDGHHGVRRRSADRLAPRAESVGPLQERGPPSVSPRRWSRWVASTSCS